MTAHALRIVHEVASLPEAARFVREVLGFTASIATAERAAFENGALGLELVAAASDGRLTLVLESDDLEGDLVALAAAGVVPGAPPWREGRELRCVAQAPAGLTLRLVQPLDEDQLGVPDPLPTRLDWPAASEALAQQLLRLVPVSFRELARRRTTDESEREALEAGRIRVEPSDVVRGLRAATPAFRRAQVDAELARLGLAGA